MTAVTIPAPLGQARLAITAGAGMLLGLAYTLSPLSVLALTAVVWASVAAARGLSAAEKRWFWPLISMSVVVRLIAIAVLFYTADPARPFASFFGDEELYKFRSMWLRNIGEGIAMSPADVIYSFDEVGHTSYIYVLAFVQALVGDAPYGLHVMNLALYVCGVLALYRLARASYGGVVAMAGLLLLMCLPTLGLWSISVLKEPMSVFLIAAEVVCVIAIVRAPRWWQKALALVAVVGFAAAMDTLREGGFLTAAAGTLGGLLVVLVLSRGRRLAGALLAAPILIAVIAGSSLVQERLMANVRSAAIYHAGHVLTPGYSYRLVNSRYYPNREQLNFMSASEAASFVTKGLVAYVVQPLPWEMKSRTMLAYLPEQIVWYALALFLPFGLYAGLRRDVVLTSVLAAHAAAAILIVAVSSGNVGTLIRHRALALPYVVWLSAVGAHECVRYLVRRREGGPAETKEQL